jgi:hypothetical protein
MWDVNDAKVRAKLSQFAANPGLVVWSRRAERDIANAARVTRLGVLEAMLDHLESGYVVRGDFMKNGDLAYILPCFVDSRRFYIKAKFIFQDADERMNIFSAHPDI